MPTLCEQIKEDSILLSWARYSIRFNSRREDQARDFIDKLRWNRRKLPGATLTAVKAALRKIESTDRDE